MLCTSNKINCFEVIPQNSYVSFLAFVMGNLLTVSTQRSALGTFPDPFGESSQLRNQSTAEVEFPIPSPPLKSVKFFHVRRLLSKFRFEGLTGLTLLGRRPVIIMGVEQDILTTPTKVHYFCTDFNHEKGESNFEN